MFFKPDQNILSTTVFEEAGCYPINGSTKTHVKKHVHHTLTWMKDSRPGNLSLGMKCFVESDVRVENIKILHVDNEDKESQPVSIMF